MEIRLWGLLGKRVKYNQKIFVYTPFLSNSPTGQVRALTTFSRLMAQMMRTHARVCLFWLLLILQPILGINLPKNNFWGANRHFPAKCAKYWNVHIIKTTA